jgi:twitching motility protein PilT
MSELLDEAIAAGASDVHLAPTEPPRLRICGELALSRNRATLPAPAIDSMLLRVAPEEAVREMRSGREADFSHVSAAGRRFRFCAFRERRGTAVAIRVISQRPPSLAELGVPPAVAKAAELSGGLVLFAGHAGAGKTTTMCSVIQELCARRTVRAVMLEDPIEYELAPERSYLEQREVGTHCSSFCEGLREALDCAPDAIAIGELRDAETIRLALRAAETGTLVFSTVHARDASRTVGRLIDAFPADERDALRTEIASALAMIFAQTLLPRADGRGRIPASELALGTPSLASLIREGKDHEIPSFLETGGGKGMHTLDASLIRLARTGRVRAEDAIASAIRKDAVRRHLGL